MTAGGEQEIGFVDKFKTGWSTIIPVGDPADLPPCPSGVSQMANPAQVCVCVRVVVAVLREYGTGFAFATSCVWD